MSTANFLCLARIDGGEHLMFLSRQAIPSQLFVTSDPGNAMLFHSQDEASAWIKSVIERATYYDWIARERLDRQHAEAERASKKLADGHGKAGFAPSRPRAVKAVKPPASLRDAVAATLGAFSLASLSIFPPDRDTPRTSIEEFLHGDSPEGVSVFL